MFVRWHTVKSRWWTTTTTWKEFFCACLTFTFDGTLALSPRTFLIPLFLEFYYEIYDLIFIDYLSRKSQRCVLKEKRFLCLNFAVIPRVISHCRSNLLIDAKLLLFIVRSSKKKDFFIPDVDWWFHTSLSTLRQIKVKMFVRTSKNETWKHGDLRRWLIHCRFFNICCCCALPKNNHSFSSHLKFIVDRDTVKLSLLLLHSWCFVCPQISSQLFMDRGLPLLTAFLN